MIFKNWLLPLIIVSMFLFGGCAKSVEALDIVTEETTIEETTTEEMTVEELSKEVVPVEAETFIEAEKETETDTESVAETEEGGSETEPALENRTVTISLAGDCSLGRLSIHGYEGTFYEMYDLMGADYFFSNVKEIFEQDDLTLVNFEGVLTDSNQTVEKKYNIKGKPEFNQILTAGSVEAVSLGNNHLIDYGQQGIDDTVAALQAVDVVYAYDDAIGIYKTESGVRIGFVSVNEVYDEEQVEVYLENGINALKEEVDLILACCHWGEELHRYPETYQRELGRKCIDWGADIVVGCHPHVLQGIDCYNGKYIIYSLGNFCFGGNKNPKDKNTMIVQAEATLDVNGIVDGMQLSVIPCTISSVSNRNDYCPTIAEGEKREEIIRKMNEYSLDFGVQITEEGHVVCK